MMNISKSKKQKAKSAGSVPRRAGFTLLFSLLISGLVLALGFSIANIVYKELKISSITRDSEAAFYAADAGVECALFWEFQGSSPANPFSGSSPVNIDCFGNSINTTVTSGAATTTHTFSLSLPAANSNYRCVVVYVNKSNSTSLTSIESNGRSTGGSASGGCSNAQNAVERSLEVTLY